MNEEARIYSMLGLAQNGGNAVSGTEGCKVAVLKNKARLVILSRDSGTNTKKFFTDKCKHRNIRLLIFGDRQALGNALGKGARTVVVITDQGIADAISKLYYRFSNNSAN